MGPLVAHAVLLALLTLPPSPFQMPASGTVLGHIYDEETGKPLKSAIVAIVEAGVEVRTRPDGSFRIDFLTPGAYSVKIIRRGYMSYRMNEVLVRPNRDARLEIRLLPADDVLQMRRAEGPAGPRVLRLADVRARAGTSDPAARLAATHALLRRAVRAARG